MRKGLAKVEGERKKFQATFSRVGKKTNYQGFSEDTILLTNILDIETGKVVADHLWFSFTKGFEDAKIKEGMLLEFDARVKPYKKGYVNKRLGLRSQKIDYKLSHPTKIVAVKSSR